MAFPANILLLFFCSAPLRAAPTAPPAPSEVAIAADSRLSAWIAKDAALQEKLARAGALAFVEPDLKDAVADCRAEAPASRRAECPDLVTCAAPPLSLELSAGDPVEPAIHALMRPWIWLTDAAGAGLRLTHADPRTATLFDMELRGLGLSGVGLNIEPRPQGGVRLWFDRAPALAALYARERDRLRLSPDARR